tara:strand:- start:3401 stop:4846 length:1446 start_codon:yes stop_codon:yes gene_type:complete
MVSVGLGSGMTAVISIIQTAVVARNLAPEDYGLFAIPLMIMGPLGVFLGGVPLAIIQQDDVSGAQLGGMQKWLYLIGMSFYLLLLLIAAFVSAQMGEWAILHLSILIGVGLLLSAMSLVHGVWLRRELRMEIQAKAEVKGNLCGMFTAMLLAVLGAGYWALAYAYVMRSLVTTYFLRRECEFRSPASGTLRQAKSMLPFGFLRAADMSLGLFTSRLDQIVVASFLGPSILGIYSVSLNLVRRPFDLVFPMLGRVLFPVYARLKGDAKMMQTAFDLSVFSFALIMLSISTLVAMYSKELVYLLLGKQWTGAIPLLPILVFYIAFMLMEAPVKQVAQALGKGKLLLYFNIVSSAFIGFVLFIVMGVLKLQLFWFCIILVALRYLFYCLAFVYLVPDGAVKRSPIFVRVLLRVVVPVVGVMAFYCLNEELGVLERTLCCGLIISVLLLCNAGYIIDNCKLVGLRSFEGLGFGLLKKSKKSNLNE